MEDIGRAAIEESIIRQREYFASGQTRSLKFRVNQLIRFKETIKLFEKRIAQALWDDLHKSFEEAYLTEISMVVQEIDNHIRHIKQWSKPKRVPTPLHLLPSGSKILYEPLGVALIVAPWNYPFQLMMNPLVGAISSGCCALLKPSPYTLNIAKVMETLISETFDPAYVTLVQGGRKVNEFLLSQRFDFIFYTGSPAVGKVVMRAAAEYLTPFVLELGGKSPCIVDAGANLDIAAKRIAWGKTINAGQTCIAPDYLLVHESVKEELILKLADSIDRMFGPDSKQSPYFPRMVNQQAFERVQKLLEKGRIRFGGQSDAAERYIAPTIIDEIQSDFPIMQEEIFGPVLPIMTFGHIDEAIAYVNSHEKPLAFYYFGKNRQAREVLEKTTSGGGCINDSLLNFANHHLPFGGVGNSGQGKYHGKGSFLAFSNSRAIVISPTWIDLPIKYAPFKGFKWVKRLL
ncbi:MAG: aldehyde dehydrogenase [Bacteroidales bacterium]|jgi:aldehyde dehydrogenase (NAD+)